MKTKEVFVPNIAWYGDEPLKLEFPSSWSVYRCQIKCEESVGLDEKEIYHALENPINVKPLSKLAEKSEEVVILIDDMTRPTKSHQFVAPILSILKKAKVKSDNIRFIMASGSHGPFGRLDFVKKLGEETVGEYQCFNHNPYEYLEYLGDTSRGTPIYVNAEYMSCDLKIGVGTILFHRLMGFSGGAKMIMPGIAGIDSIKYNHGDVGGFGPGLTPNPSTGYLKNDGNEMRLDAEEFAKISGLNFKIDSVLNLKRDPIDIYAGDFIETQRRASESALKWHKCPTPTDMDIVIANTYARANEAQIGMWPSYQSVKNDGSIVLIANAPDGEINHWIFGRHGKNRGARLWNPVRHPLQKGKRLIIYSPYKERTHDMRIGLPEQTVWIKDWAEVIEILKAEHGSNARVAVIPDATLGIPENI